MLHLLPTVPGDEPVTDTRFPDRWLHDMRLLTLSDYEFRAYAMSLMFAVTNRTDGRLTPRHLMFIPCGPDDDTVAALVKAGLWEKTDDGWTIVDFLATQSTAAQIAASEAYAARERERKALAGKSKSGKGRAGTARADPARDAGQDRDRTGREVEGSSEQRFSGSDAEQLVDSARLDRSSDDGSPTMGKCRTCPHWEPLLPDGRCQSCHEWDVPEEEEAS